MEQTARALNVVCRRWLNRRNPGSGTARVAAVIQYHQKRIAAAKRSRLPSPRRNE